MGKLISHVPNPLPTELMGIKSEGLALGLQHLCARLLLLLCLFQQSLVSTFCPLVCVRLSVVLSGTGLLPPRTIHSTSCR